jgi:hypothetical protein
MKTKGKTDMTCYKTREQRRIEAIERNKRWESLSVAQQIQRKIQRGYPEGKQMDRLLKKQVDQTKTVGR